MYVGLIINVAPWVRQFECCSYLRPLGECWPVLLIEEVEQLVLLVQGHHLTDSLIVLFLLLQCLDKQGGNVLLGDSKICLLDKVTWQKLVGSSPTHHKAALNERYDNKYKGEHKSWSQGSFHAGYCPDIRPIQFAMALRLTCLLTPCGRPVTNVFL